MKNTQLVKCNIYIAIISLVVYILLLPGCSSIWSFTKSLTSTLLYILLVIVVIFIVLACLGGIICYFVDKHEEKKKIALGESYFKINIKETNRSIRELNEEINQKFFVPQNMKDRLNSLKDTRSRLEREYSLYKAKAKEEQDRRNADQQKLELEIVNQKKTLIEEKTKKEILDSEQEEAYQLTNIAISNLGIAFTRLKGNNEDVAIFTIIEDYLLNLEDENKFSLIKSEFKDALIQAIKTRRINLQKYYQIQKNKSKNNVRTEKEDIDIYLLKLKSIVNRLKKIEKKYC